MSGKLHKSICPICNMIEFPNIRRWPLLSGGVPAGQLRSKEMKRASTARQMKMASAGTMLAEVVDRLPANPDLSDTRKRDLRSAIVTYGKIVGQPLAEIQLDLAAIRKTLDGVVPLQAKVSRKRWANLRSDIAAAIAASGLQPMLKTSEIKVNEDWEQLLEFGKRQEDQ